MLTYKLRAEYHDRYSIKPWCDCWEYFAACACLCCSVCQARAPPLEALACRGAGIAPRMTRPAMPRASGPLSRIMATPPSGVPVAIPTSVERTAPWAAVTR